MSKLRGLLFGGRDRNAQAKKAVEPIEKDYPVVAEILAGCEAEGDSPAIPGGTISFWIYDGRLRASVNVKSQGKCFFLDVADITKPWASIQLAIELGEFGEKAEDVRRSTTEQPAF